MFLVKLANSGNSLTCPTLGITIRDSHKTQLSNKASSFLLDQNILAYIVMACLIDFILILIAKIDPVGSMFESVKK